MHIYQYSSTPIPFSENRRDIFLNFDNAFGIHDSNEIMKNLNLPILENNTDEGAAAAAAH